MTAISVVITAHHSQAWLDQALASVCAQSHARRELETLVVCDGADDAAGELARALLVRHAMEGRVLTATPGSGVGAALNLGWRAAGGEWVQFLAGRDILAPSKIALQTGAITQLPEAVGMIFSSWQRLRPVDRQWLPAGPAQSPRLSDRQIVAFLASTPLGSALVRKRSLAAVAGFSEEPAHAWGSQLLVLIAAFASASSLADACAAADSALPLFFERDIPESRARKLTRLREQLEHMLAVKAMLQHRPPLLQAHGDAIADVCRGCLHELRNLDGMAYRDGLRRVRDADPRLLGAADAALGDMPRPAPVQPQNALRPASPARLRALRQPDPIARDAAAPVGWRGRRAEFIAGTMAVLVLLAAAAALGPFASHRRPVAQPAPVEAITQRAGVPTIVVASTIYAEPASAWPLPVEIVPRDAAPPDGVLEIEGLPSSVTLSVGRRLSTDVWAVPVAALANLEVEVAAGTSGRSRLALTLYGADNTALADVATAIEIGEVVAEAGAGAGSRAPAGWLGDRPQAVPASESSGADLAPKDAPSGSSAPAAVATAGTLSVEGAPPPPLQIAAATSPTPARAPPTTVQVLEPEVGSVTGSGFTAPPAAQERSAAVALKAAHATPSPDARPAGAANVASTASAATTGAAATSPSQQARAVGASDAARESGPALSARPAVTANEASSIPEATPTAAATSPPQQAPAVGAARLPGPVPTARPAGAANEASSISEATSTAAATSPIPPAQTPATGNREAARASTLSPGSPVLGPAKAASTDPPATSVLRATSSTVPIEKPTLDVSTPEPPPAGAASEASAPPAAAEAGTGSPTASQASSSSSAADVAQVQAAREQAPVGSARMTPAAPARAPTPDAYAAQDGVVEPASPTVAKAERTPAPAAPAAAVGAPVLPSAAVQSAAVDGLGLRAAGAPPEIPAASAAPDQPSTPIQSAAMQAIVAGSAPVAHEALPFVPAPPEHSGSLARGLAPPVGEQVPAAIAPAAPPAMSDGEPGPAALPPAGERSVPAQSALGAAAREGREETTAQGDRRLIAALLARGERDLADGNVAMARQSFLRAADAGMARAALLLARTYDAHEFARLGVQGMQGNTRLARIWYQRARELGAIEAGPLLRRLGVED